MDTLIALGTGTAWLYSMLVVLIPGFFPDGTRHVYFEASVMILGLINLGHALELRARGKTSEAVQKLIGLQSNTAIKITEDGDETVAIAALVVGDKLRLARVTEWRSTVKCFQAIRCSMSPCSQANPFPWLNPWATV